MFFVRIQEERISCTKKTALVSRLILNPSVLGITTFFQNIHITVDSMALINLCLFYNSFMYGFFFQNDMLLTAFHLPNTSWFIFFTGKKKKKRTKLL